MNCHPLFTSIWTILLVSGETLADRKNVKLVIIGAGPSGYAAGCKLLENNFTDFIILEAQDRIGGRVHSIPYGNGTIDMGGQWIHGIVGNPVYQLARDLNLVYSVKDFFRGGKVYRSDGKVYEDTMFQQLFAIFSDIVDNTDAMKGYNKSLGDYFTERYWPKITPLIENGNITHAEAESFLVLMEHMENSNDASPNWFETSITERSEFGETGNDFINVWKFEKVPKPGKQLVIDDKISLRKEVTKVDWSGARVSVICADGTHVTADRVLVTVSLNVLKATANSIFQPALPESNVKAIQNLGMGTVNKIYLEFPYRWWELGQDGLMTVWRAEDVASLPPNLKWTTGLYSFTPVDGHPLDLLCGWINGKEAEEMEKYSDDVVKEEAVKLLRRFVGSSAEVPDALAVYRSRWFSNPYTRGSYSCRMLTSDAADVWADDLAQPVVSNFAGKPNPVILFAGEATNSHNYATVHGAVETGWREAQRILNL